MEEHWGERDAGTASPTSSPIVLPTETPVPRVESFAAGAARSTGDDGVDE